MRRERMGELMTVAEEEQLVVCSRNRDSEADV